MAKCNYSYNGKIYSEQNMKDLLSKGEFENDLSEVKRENSVYSKIVTDQGDIVRKQDQLLIRELFLNIITDSVFVKDGKTLNPKTILRNINSLSQEELSNNIYNRLDFYLEQLAQGNEEQKRIVGIINSAEDKFVNDAIKKLKTFGVKLTLESNERIIPAEDSDNEIDENSNPLSNDNYDSREASEISPLEYLNSSIRLALSKLTNGETNDIGFPKLIDSSTAHNALVVRMANKESIVDMIDELKQMVVEKQLWANQLLNYLSLDDAKTKDEIKDIQSFRNDFISAYRQVKLNQVNTLIDDQRGEVLSENASDKAENIDIIARWRSEARNIAVNKPFVWSLNENNNTRLNKKALEQNYIQNIQKGDNYLAYLSNLGIIFDIEPAFNEGSMLQQIKYFHNSLIKALEKNNNIESLQDVTDIGSDMKYFFELFKKHMFTPLNQQSTGVEGEKRYNVFKPNNIIDTKIKLNKLKQGDNFFERFPKYNTIFSKGSYLIANGLDSDGLVTEYGEKLFSNLNIEIDNGLAINNSGEQGIKTQGLNSTDREIQDIKTILSTGYIPSFQHADKSTSISYNLFSGDLLYKLDKSTDDKLKLGGSLDLMRALDFYFNSDIGVVIDSLYEQYHNPENVKHYDRITNTLLSDDSTKFDFTDKNGKKYKFGNMSNITFSSIILDNNEVRKTILDNIKKSKNEILGIVYETHLSNWMEKLTNEFDKKGGIVDNTIQRWIDAKLFPEGVENLNIKSLTNPQTENDRNFVKDLTKTIRGNKNGYYLRGISKSLLSVKANSKVEALPEMYLKLRNLARAFELNSMIGLNEQARLFYNDIRWNKNPIDFIKRASANFASKSVCRNDFEINKTLEDFNRLDGRNTNPDFKEGGQYFGKFKTVILAEDDNYISSSLDNILSNVTDESLKESINKSYGNINEADGQAYVSLDEYREILERSGKLTPELEDTYHRLVAQAQKVREGNSLTIEDMVTPNLLNKFVSLKTQLAGLGSNGKPYFYKHSVATYIPQIMAGTKLQNMFEYMIDNQVGLLQYASATKVGVPVRADGSSYQYYDENGNLNLNSEELELFTEYPDYDLLGIQVDMAFKPKDKVPKGTQEEKLLWTNIINNGDINNKLDEAIGEYNILRENGLKKAIEELGLELTEDGDNYIVNKPEQLVKRLLREAEDRQLNDNIIESIMSLLDDPNMDNLPNKEQVEPILASMLDSYMIKHKFVGEAYVQMAVTGFEKSNRKLKDGKKLSNERLSFYEVSELDNRILPMQIGIPITKEIKSILNNGDYFNKLINESIYLIQSNNSDKFFELFEGYTGFDLKTQGIENVNLLYQALIDQQSNKLDVLNLIVAAINSNYRTNSEIDFNNNEFISNFYNYAMDMVSFRIPTQGQNSIEHPVVGFFMDSIVGTTVICPTEMSAKSGSDYDIDKLFTYRKKYKLDGNTLVSTDDNINNLLNIQQEILRNKEIFDSLITPNSTSHFDKYIDAIEGINVNYGNIYTQNVQTKLSRAFSSGGKGIGVQAVSSTSHALAQKAKLTLLPVINTGEKGERLSKMFGVINLKDGEFSKKYSNKLNRDENGNITLYEVKTKDLETISDILSQVMDGFVDIAKNPWTTGLNLTDETAGIFDTAIKMGLPLKDAVELFQSNSVKYYNQLISEDKSLFLKSDKSTRRTKTDRINMVLGKYANNITEYGNFMAYMELSYISDAMLKLTSIANGDTKGNGGNITSIIERQLNYEELSNVTPAFTPDSLTRYVEEGIHGVYWTAINDSEKIMSAFSAITKIPKLKNNLITIYKNLRETTLGAANRDKLFKRLKSDMLQYFIHKDFNINDYLDFFDLENKMSLPVMLSESRRNYPSIFKNNEFLKVLKSEVPARKNDDDISVNNLTLFNRSMGAEEANLIIEGFEDLYRHDDEGMRDLAKQISKFAIIQSGGTKHSFNFTEFIPSDLFKEIIKDIDYSMNENQLVDFYISFLWNNTDLVKNAEFELEVMNIRDTKGWRDYQMKLYNTNVLFSNSFANIQSLNYQDIYNDLTDNIIHQEILDENEIKDIEEPSESSIC